MWWCFTTSSCGAQPACAERCGAKTLAQLKALDIGRWRNKACRGEGILTLEEALEVFAGKVDLCLEIKNYPKSLPGIELKMLFILSHYDYLDRTIVSSFDYRSLARVRELAPDIAIGLIFGAAVKQDPFQAAKQLAATSLHVQKSFATREFLSDGVGRRVGCSRLDRQ